MYSRAARLGRRPGVVPLAVGALVRPRVSVVVATWNWSAALRCSVRSALRQSLGDFELLVVGDCCTDDSAAVVESFRDPRVHWHNLPERTGSQVGPNNAALARARGEYVAYLGHDDLWHPDHLASLVATLEAERADLAFATTILYGPPGSGLRAVAGLAPPAAGGPLRNVPTSAWLHRRDLTARVGGWRDHRTLTVPPDYELLRRARESGARFAASERLTVFKFPAAWRRDAYVERSAEEQQAFQRRLEADPHLDARELLAALAAAAEGKLVDADRPGEGPPGAIVESAKAFKGAVDELPAAQRRDRLRFDFDMPLPGFEWHGVERHPEHGTFQWSGPGRSAGLDLPLTVDRDLRLAFAVLAPLAVRVLDSLRLAVNGAPTALAVSLKEDGPTIFRATLPAADLARSRGPVRLRFDIAETLRPCDVVPGSTDRRALGLPFCWLEVEPAPV